MKSRTEPKCSIIQALFPAARRGLKLSVDAAAEPSFGALTFVVKGGTPEFVACVELKGVARHQPVWGGLCSSYTVIFTDAVTPCAFSKSLHVVQEKETNAMSRCSYAFWQ
jgi:hypothetical protein